MNTTLCSLISFNTLSNTEVLKHVMKMSLWPQIGNKKLNPKQIRIHTILKIVAVKISEPIQMIVVPVYRPPSTPIDVFMNHMLEIIAQFQHVPTPNLGDFNEDVSITSNTHSCAMLRLQAFSK